MRRPLGVFEDIIRDQDDFEFQLGDTLDIKTSIVLVVITFLATQSADFLKGTPILSPFWSRAQILSILCLIIAGMLALYELLPKKYMVRMPPDQFLKWVEDLSDFYKEEADPIAKIDSAINDVEIERIKARFAQNSSINALKSRLLVGSFYFSLTALVINLFTLLSVSLAS